jgi:hypothetical protein
MFLCLQPSLPSLYATISLSSITAFDNNVNDLFLKIRPQIFLLYFATPMELLHRPNEAKPRVNVPRLLRAEGIYIEMVSTTAITLNKFPAAEVTASSEIAVSLPTVNKIVIQNTKMPFPPAPADTETHIQKTARPSQPETMDNTFAQDTNLRARKGFSTFHTIERAISATHRFDQGVDYEYKDGDEKGDAEKILHCADNEADCPNNSEHGSNSGVSFTSKAMTRRASRISSAAQTRETPIAHNGEKEKESEEEKSDAIGDGDGDGVTMQPRGKRKRKWMEEERDEEADVIEIPATMPIPPPRSLTATAPLPGSDLLGYMNVSDYQVNIPPPNPARPYFFTLLAPVTARSYAHLTRVPQSNIVI